jgi:hypothetical protein
MYLTLERPACLQQGMETISKYTFTNLSPLQHDCKKYHACNLERFTVVQRIKLAYSMRSCGNVLAGQHQVRTFCQVASLIINSITTIVIPIALSYFSVL